ncbi:MAG: zincin-like metallopeptidase domain-containing protein [Gallionella sp.]|nr:zincin-like metallopeptidase domain-containing protein [Gallionella sp.]
MNANHTNSKSSQTTKKADAHQTACEKSDIYQTITDKIIEALEAGSAPWVKPWASLGAPRNAITGREYSGINTVLLAMTEFSSNQWLTFQQARQAGGNVKKGEKGTTVVFFKPLTIKEKAEAQGDDKEKVIPLLRTFTVFNTQQIENLPEKFNQPIKPQLSEFEDNAAAETLLNQAKIQYGMNRACFIPSLDKIHLPNKTDFKSIPDFYAVALHELTHWSGHKNRLARDFSGRFGDAAYAFEELVAELGAAFLCASTGVDGQLQHDSYIASWLKVLKNDKKAIFTAAAAARKASEFLTADQNEDCESAAA